MPQPARPATAPQTAAPPETPDPQASHKTAPSPAAAASRPARRHPDDPETEAAAEVPNPSLHHQEEQLQREHRIEESDTGRHGDDRSRPSSFVRKTH